MPTSVKNIISDPDRYLETFKDECLSTYLDVNSRLKIQGRLIDVQATHPADLGRINELYSIVKSLHKHACLQTDYVYAKLYKKHKVQSKRLLTPEDVRQWVRSEDEWYQLKCDELSYAELEDKLKQLIDALGAKGWAISHLTKLVTAEISDLVI